MLLNDMRHELEGALYTVSLSIISGPRGVPISRYNVFIVPAESAHLLVGLSFWQRNPTHICHGAGSLSELIQRLFIDVAMTHGDRPNDGDSCQVKEIVA